jgi:diguanylate cyclase (GGDEF)-like protein
VRKVSDAISMIGLNNLLSLVLGMSLAGIFNKLALPPSSVQALWRASLLKSVAAQEYARKFAPEFAEEAAVCGLLQDMALPVIQAADPSVWPSYLPVLDQPESTRGDSERAMFGFDHAQFGAMLAKRLQLPDLYRVLTEHHHAAIDAEKAAGANGLARACQFAAGLPHRAGDRPQVDRLTGALPGNAAGDAGEVAGLLKRINDSYRQMLQMLGDEDEGGAAFKEFVREVTGQVAKCLTSSIGESAARIQTLHTSNVTLEDKVKKLEDVAVKSEHDALTGVLIRAAWLRRCQRLFALCREHQVGCAIGFLDVDNFKSVNDNHSHKVGDAALIKVGSTLQKMLGDRGLVGRLGGDEFAFALVCKTEAEVQSRLNNAGAAVNRFTLDGADSKPLDVTASIGAFWMGVPNADLKVEAALESADKLMYEAKKGGKARCVFGQLRQPAQPAAA